jgi:hypothetical protein
MKLCDYGCGKEAKYKLKNGKLCCSENFRSCSQMKENKKQTCIEKYGDVCSLQNKEVQEKRRQTNIKKYGVEHHFKNKAVQEKRKQTCMEKYGVDNPLKNKKVQEKRKQTNMEKYGANHHTQSAETKEKLLEKHPFFCQAEEIKIEDNQFKVHCKNSNCKNSKEKGGWFIPTFTQIHNRIGDLEDETGNDGCFFYCSQYCKTTCLAFNVHGDPERDTQLPYTREQYETFKLHVLTRDKYICQYCGAPATDVHHERAVKLQPFHAVDPDYGWSCCEKCHYEKGHKKGTECSTGNLAAAVCRPIIKKKEIT